MRVRLLAVQPNGQMFTIQAEADGMALAVELPYVEGEGTEDCRARVRQALLRAIGDADRQGREERAARLRRRLDGFAFEVERPSGPVYCALEGIGGQLLCGQAVEPDHDYLIVLREPDGSERERLVHTDRFGRFSVDLGKEYRALCVIPMNPMGLTGHEIRLPDQRRT